MSDNMNAPTNILQKPRHLVVLVDYAYSNPQGDPDMGNRPRTDPYTGHGIITGMGLKRKIRNWLEANGHKIFVSRNAVLKNQTEEACKKVGVKNVENASIEDKDKVVKHLANEYADVRFFGQVLPNVLPVRGPVQVSMGVSVERVAPIEDTITRVAREKAQAKKGAKSEDGEDGNGVNKGMGKIHYIPYGLYRFHIYVTPHDARKTGFTEEDYELFVEALKSMFDIDRSSARGRMAVRAIYEFSPKAKEHGLLGDRLLDKLKVVRKDASLESGEPARSWDDYRVVEPSYNPQEIEMRNLLPE